MNPQVNFDIADIDGCEFVYSRGVGNMLISWDRDFDGYETGKVRVVYADGSGRPITPEEAQSKIDSGEWTVYHRLHGEAVNRPDVTNRVIALLDAQNDKGIAKYGTTIDEARDEHYDWKMMALEEMTDALHYQQKEIMRLERLLNPKEE